jgi:hypothetical protein
MSHVPLNIEVVNAPFASVVAATTVAACQRRLKMS